MKNVINSKILTLSLCVAILSSCEKEETFVDETSITNQEGFMGEIGQSDAFIDESSSAEAKKPLLHMSFGSDMSREEASAQFDKVVAKYKSTNLNQSKDVSTNWIYRVSTYTGLQSNNNTDANVKATVYFDTDKKDNVKDDVILDIKDYNDREGGWDFYMFEGSLPGQAVQEVEVKSAKISLKGRDGWFLKKFDIEISSRFQDFEAAGRSTIFSDPNVLLDNVKKTDWSHYETGEIGTGKVTF